MKKIIILLGIFIGFYLVGHYSIRWRNRQAVEPAAATRLVDCDLNKIHRIKITQKEKGIENSFLFERVDAKDASLPISAQTAKAEWRIIAPKNIEADSTMLTRYAAQICEIYNPINIRKEDFVPSEAAERRATKVEFNFYGEDDFSHSLQFGLVGADRMNVVEYSSSGKNIVAKIPPTLLQASSLSADSYTNYRVMKMNVDNIQAATIYMDGKEKFSVERAGSDWKVLRQGKELGIGAEAGKYLNRLATLRGIQLLDTEFPQEKCEKEKNNVRVEFSGIANKRETLYFTTQNTKQISSCSNARTSKFEIHKDILKYIFIPADKLLAKGTNQKTQL